MRFQPPMNLNFQKRPFMKLKASRGARKLPMWTALALAVASAAMIAACGGGGREATESDSAPTATKAVTQQATTAAPAAPAGDGDEFAAAKSLFKSKGCIGCHMVSGIAEATGTIGPSLDGLASRAELAAGLTVNAENLAKWIKEPSSVKPGTVMPRLGLDDADVDTLVGWLLTLK
jgi:cytochrome c2